MKRNREIERNIERGDREVSEAINDLMRGKPQQQQTSAVEELKDYMHQLDEQKAEIALNFLRAADGGHVGTAKKAVPNIQLKDVRPISAEFIPNRAIRESALGQMGTPAYVASFCNEPTGTPISDAYKVGAKITYGANDFDVDAMGLWTTGERQTDIPVGATRRLWLAAIPPNGVPLTVEPPSNVKEIGSRLEHKFLRNRIPYVIHVLLFAADGTGLTEASCQLEFQ
jgi:hypothetical protein